MASKTNQADPLNLLTSAAQGDPEDAPRSAAGVKGIASRQLLAESFRKHPERVEAIFRERLALARRNASSSEVEAKDRWYHFMEQVPLGSHRTLAYMAFLSSAMFEAMERGQGPRLRMLVCLMAVFVEQAVYDGGSLKMAHLLTTLEDPPFSMTELRKVGRGEFPHAQLADPRWIATNLAFLKDLEGIQDKSAKYVKQPGGKQPDTTEAETKKAPKKWPKKSAKKPESSEEAA